MAHQQVSGPTWLIPGFEHILYHGTQTFITLLAYALVPCQRFDVAVSSPGARGAPCLCTTSVTGRDVMTFWVASLGKREDELNQPNSGTSANRYARRNSLSSRYLDETKLHQIEQKH